MSEQLQMDLDGDEGGVVIPFPGAWAGSTPPPLPRLPRAIPTPGAALNAQPFFGATMSRRYDRDAA